MIYSISKIYEPLCAGAVPEGDPHAGAGAPFHPSSHSTIPGVPGPELGPELMQTLHTYMGGQPVDMQHHEGMSIHMTIT